MEENIRYLLAAYDCEMKYIAKPAPEAEEITGSIALHANDVIRLGERSIEINGAAPTLPEGTAAEHCVFTVSEAEAFFEKNTTEITEELYAETVAARNASAEETSEEAAQPAESDENTEQPQAEAQKEKQEAETYSAKQLLSDALDLIESVLTSVFVVMMIFTFVFCIAAVDGDSMIPTLNSQDRLMVTRLSRSFENGDILILDSSEACIQDSETNEFITKNGLGKRIVKRLIAQGGDRVNIDFEQGIVYVNDVALDEPYTNTLTKRDNGAFSYPLTVPEGYVFVLGDNRNISKDSRHPQVGLVPEESVIGKVVLRIAPFSSFGTVK